MKRHESVVFKINKLTSSKKCIQKHKKGSTSLRWMIHIKSYGLCLWLLWNFAVFLHSSEFILELSSALNEKEKKHKPSIILTVQAVEASPLRAQERVWWAKTKHISCKRQEAVREEGGLCYKVLVYGCVLEEGQSCCSFNDYKLIHLKRELGSTWREVIWFLNNFSFTCACKLTRGGF